MNLSGKCALVTGGTKGIGAATALGLAGKGADVAIVSRHDDSDARSVLKAIGNLGRACTMITADMAKAEDARRAVEETVESLGGLDVLVHNAGGGAPGFLTEVPEETWYYAFDVHVHAAFHLCRAAIPHLKERGEGAIVLLSSVAALRGFPGAIAYGVVKGALVQFARGLARELADDNIRVNGVAPGIIRTAFHAAMTPEQERNNLDNRIPLHTFGNAEQVADVILLLAENDYITGETYTIDGGLTMRMP